MLNRVKPASFSMIFDGRFYEEATDSRHGLGFACLSSGFWRCMFYLLLIFMIGTLGGYISGISLSMIVLGKTIRI